MALRAAFLSIGIVFFVLSALPVSAQFGLPGLEESVRLEAYPANPKPGEKVHVTAQSVFLDLQQMEVTWRVNDVVIAKGMGVMEADFTVGSLGQPAVVTMNALSDTNTAFSRLTIVASEVDLLWESDSYIPPFYRGRALPSEGAKVRLQAIPRLRRSDGTTIPNESLKFTWKAGGSIVSSASGIGRSSALLEGPVHLGSEKYSVDIISTDGLVSGTASVSIASVQPFVALYENHPLFGVLFHKPLGALTYTRENEVTYAAIPFYVPAKSPDDRSLQYNWKVNDAQIQPDELHRSALTIHSGDARGEAIVNLDLSQNSNLLLNISKQWNVVFGQTPAGFGADGGSTGVNPFTQQ